MNTYRIECPGVDYLQATIEERSPTSEGYGRFDRGADVRAPSLAKYRLTMQVEATGDIIDRFLAVIRGLEEKPPTQEGPKGLPPNPNHVYEPDFEPR